MTCRYHLWLFDAQNIISMPKSTKKVKSHPIWDKQQWYYWDISRTTISTNNRKYYNFRQNGTTTKVIALGEGENEDVRYVTKW